MMHWREIRLTGLNGGLLLSFILHGLIAAALLFDLPRLMAEPEPEEQVVAVTLVAPPEPETAEAEPPEEPEAPEPEAPEPESPNPETPEPEQTAVAPPPAALPEGDAVPIPVLRPVFQYGAEDAGPDIAPDGGAAEAPAEDATETPPAESAVEPATETVAAVETAAEPEAAAEPDTAPEPAPEPETAAQDQPQAEDPIEPASPAPTTAMPADIVLPDAELAGDSPADLPEAAEQTETALLPDKPAEPTPSPPEPDPAKAKPDPASAAPSGAEAAPPADAVPVDNAPAGDNGLPGVRKLSSSVDTGHAVATAAMGALPRDERGSRLCTSELREQLRRAPESYQVELLPAYRLPGGTVLAVPKAAFRAGGGWYNLSFRCTVDTEALRVTDFTFKVGAAIPRAEWRQRGFPDL